MIVGQWHENISLINIRDEECWSDSKGVNWYFAH